MTFVVKCSNYSGSGSYRFHLIMYISNSFQFQSFNWVLFALSNHKCFMPAFSSSVAPKYLLKFHPHPNTYYYTYYKFLKSFLKLNTIFDFNVWSKLLLINLEFDCRDAWYLRNDVYPIYILEIKCFKMFGKDKK